MEWILAAKRQDFKPETGVTVELKGRLVALFQNDGGFYATDDSCPHMGASLGAGHLCGDIVMCPWHAWRFRVTDGVWVDTNTPSLKCHPTKMEGDDIYVQVSW